MRLLGQRPNKSSAPGGSKEREVSKFAALLLQLMLVCFLAGLRAEPQHPPPMYDEAELAVAVIAASHNSGPEVPH